MGELHQELEAETEGQVNRLLHMIRIQQDQLSTLQRQNDNNATTETSPTNSESAGLPTPSSALSASHNATPVDHPSPRSGSMTGVHGLVSVTESPPLGWKCRRSASTGALCPVPVAGFRLLDALPMGGTGYPTRVAEAAASVAASAPAAAGHVCGVCGLG